METKIKMIYIVLCDDPDTLGDTDGIDVDSSFHRYMELVEERMGQEYPDAKVIVTLGNVEKIRMYDSDAPGAISVYDERLDRVDDILHDVFQSGDWAVDVRYSCVGDVRGDCGHKHKSIRTAYECLMADRRACKEHGGYSDRRIHRSDGRELSDSEIDEIGRMVREE